MKTFTIDGTECYLYADEYYTGNLAIIIMCDEGDYDDLTVNLDFLMPGFAFINPRYEELVKELGIGKSTGKTRQSGFNTYPLYEFDADELEKWSD